MFHPTRVRRVIPPSPALHESGHIEMGRAKITWIFTKGPSLGEGLDPYPHFLSASTNLRRTFFSPHKSNTDGDLE